MNPAVRRIRFRQKLRLLLNLNLFDTVSQDSATITRQRITTWVFLSCLISTMLVCAIYWSISTQTKTIKINNPNLAEYEALLTMNLSDLQCPCSQIMIPYSQFLRIEASFHQVCSSKMISPDWYDSLAEFQRIMLSDFFNFPTSHGGNFFRILHILCDFVRNYAADAYNVFSSNVFIASQIISSEIFPEQTSIMMNSFTETTVHQFEQLLIITRTLFYVNQIITATRSNFGGGFKNDNTFELRERFLAHPEHTALKYVSSNPLSSEKYSLSDDADSHELIEFPTLISNLVSDESNGSMISTTTEPSTVFPPIRPVQCSCLTVGEACGYFATVQDSNPIYSIPINSLLFYRCTLVESVLTSALECWYSSVCVEILQTAYTSLGITDRFTEVLLNKSVPSRFDRRMSVVTMMKQLLIENWTKTASYEDFYRQCAPIHCSYTIEERFDWIFVFFNLVGLNGGLNKILKLTLPWIILVWLACIRSLKNRLNQRSIHTISSNNTDMSPATTGKI